MLIKSYLTWIKCWGNVFSKYLLSCLEVYLVSCSKRVLGCGRARLGRAGQGQLALSHWPSALRLTHSQTHWLPVKCLSFPTVCICFSSQNLNLIWFRLSLRPWRDRWPGKWCPRAGAACPGDSARRGDGGWPGPGLLPGHRGCDCRHHGAGHFRRPRCTLCLLWKGGSKEIGRYDGLWTKPKTKTKLCDWSQMFKTNYDIDIKSMEQNLV